MQRARTAIALAAGVSLLLIAACGGDDSSDDAAREGDAANVTAQFFSQEQAGNLLPEKGVGIRTIGVERIEVLAINDDQRDGDVQARFCLEHKYQELQESFPIHTRVYVAELIDDAWQVEAVNPDGTCDGVV